MHSSSATVLFFGEVGRCAEGTPTKLSPLLAAPPELVVYDRPVPGIPTVVWLFPVVLTVCFRPFGPKLMLALFLFRFTRTPGATLKLRLNLVPMLFPPMCAF